MTYVNVETFHRPSCRDNSDVLADIRLISQLPGRTTTDIAAGSITRPREWGTVARSASLNANHAVLLVAAPPPLTIPGPDFLAEMSTYVPQLTC